jgi:hypothetical protein
MRFRASFFQDRAAPASYTRVLWIGSPVNAGRRPGLHMA